MQQTKSNMLYLFSHFSPLKKVKKPYVFPLLWLNEVSIFYVY